MGSFRCCGVTTSFRPRQLGSTLRSLHFSSGLASEGICPRDACGGETDAWMRMRPRRSGRSVRPNSPRTVSLCSWNLEAVAFRAEAGRESSHVCLLLYPGHGDDDGGELRDEAVLEGEGEGLLPQLVTPLLLQGDGGVVEQPRHPQLRPRLL